MTLNALVSTVSSRTRCEAGEPAQKGGTVLRQAADEGFVGGFDFRCAKEGLWMTECAQNATGYGGHL